jgi:hypothetical protein
VERGERQGSARVCWLGTEHECAMTKMGKLDRQGWIIFGGTIAMVLAFGVSAVMLPQSEKLYCTADLDTCIMNGRSRPWHVRDKPCPAGEELRFVSGEVLRSISRCHSIKPPGFSAPLSVCPAVCTK